MEEEEDHEAMKQRILEENTLKLQLEFRSVFKNFRSRSNSIDWRSLSKILNLGLKLPKKGPIELMDLWEVDMGKVMKHVFIDVPNSTELYGYIPRMATASRASIGSHVASSFPERINSAANLTLTKGNSLLSTEEINMLTVLRINRNFMIYMRKKYPSLSLQQFGMTTIPDAMNEEDEVVPVALDEEDEVVPVALDEEELATVSDTSEEKS